MRAIPKGAETGDCPAALFSLVEECARIAQPDEESLRAWADSYARNHGLRLARDLQLAQQYIPGGAKLAEFGAAPFFLTLALRRLDYEVTGIDIDPTRFGRMIRETNLRIVRCDIETEALPFETASFDAALFNELFEHLRIDLVHTMGELRRVLKPEGLLLLSSPNLRSLQGILNFLLRNRATSCAEDIHGEYEKLRKFGHMGHVREYTTREVCEFLDLVGFRVERMIFRGNFGAGWMTQAARLVTELRPYVTYVARAKP